MNLSPTDAQKLLVDLERQFSFLAEDLHDRLCQDLAGAALLVSTIGRTLERGRPLPPDQFHALPNALDTAIDHLRSASTQFSPSDLSGTGLMLALENLSHRLSERIQSRFLCEKPVMMASHSAALAFFRTAQHLCKIPAFVPPDHEIILELKADRSSVLLEVTLPTEYLPADSILLKVFALAFNGKFSLRLSGKTSVATLRLPSS